MTLRRVSPAVFVVALLAGCTQDPSALSPEELLEPCTTVSEIAVETLEGLEPECEPVGSTLVFPDGAKLEVSSGGGSMSNYTGDGEPVKSYGFQTVGIYGVVAASWVDDCTDFQSWGRPEAIAKAHRAFGEFLGHC